MRFLCLERKLRTRERKASSLTSSRKRISFLNAQDLHSFRRDQQTVGLTESSSLSSYFYYKESWCSFILRILFLSTPSTVVFSYHFRRLGLEVILVSLFGLKIPFIPSHGCHIILLLCLNLCITFCNMSMLQALELRCFINPEEKRT